MGAIPDGTHAGAMSRPRDPGGRNSQTGARSGTGWAGRLVGGGFGRGGRGGWEAATELRGAGRVVAASRVAGCGGRGAFDAATEPSRPRAGPALLSHAGTCTGTHRVVEALGRVVCHDPPPPPAAPRRRPRRRIPRPRLQRAAAVERGRGDGGDVVGEVERAVGAGGGESAEGVVAVGGVEDVAAAEALEGRVVVLPRPARPRSARIAAAALAAVFPTARRAPVGVGARSCAAGGASRARWAPAAA